MGGGEERDGGDQRWGVVVVVAHNGDIRGLWDPYLLDGPYISVGPTLGEFFGLVWKHPVAATINGPFRALSLSHPYIHTLPLTLFSLPLKNFVAFFSLSVLDLQ